MRRVRPVVTFDMIARVSGGCAEATSARNRTGPLRATFAAGGDGPDTMSGASGNDRLTGGPGGDRFSGGSGTDTATDLTTAEGDNQDGTIP
jgi:hemolysin type calcium-binding protein